MSWEKVKLGEVCTSITDGDHQSLPLAEKGIPFVVIADIDSMNRIDFANARYVPQDYYDALDDKRKPQKGDVLLTVKGSFGIPAYVDTEAPFVFQRDIAILKCNEKIDSLFLFYQMRSREFYLYADSIAIGAAQRAITLKALRNMTINIPSLGTQKRIADRLFFFDKLIENNQKQIKLLEEAAQRLYKEWFVDLRFPGYEDTPIVDDVPEGWKKELIGNLIGKTIRSKQVKTAEYLNEGIIPVIDQSRDFIAGYTNDLETIVDIGCPVIVFGDHTRILKYVQFPFAKGADGTQLIVSNNANMPQSLLYYSLILVDLSNYHYARHFKYLKSESILVPVKEIADKFDNYVAPILLNIQKLRDISYRVAEARDRLLPKLMNEELEV